MPEVDSFRIDDYIPFQVSDDIATAIFAGESPADNIGIGYAFFGLGGLVLCALGGDPVWFLLFSPVYLVLGSIYLASAVARSRRER